MRIWSLAPRYLDRAGLIACWRETLLAQAVLAGRTRGYRQHPQLERFRAQDDPLAAVGRYLTGLADEADDRGYRFRRELVVTAEAHVSAIPVTAGQLEYEWAHLRAKLAARSPEVARRWAAVTVPDPHPLFLVEPGGVASWERPGPAAPRGR